jgi:hypothetical protein
MRFEDRTELVRKFTERGVKGRAGAVPLDDRDRGQPPPAHDRTVGSGCASAERADFDDLVTLVTGADVG